MKSNVVFNNRQMMLNTAKWLLAYADDKTYDDTPAIDNPSTFMTCFYFASVLSTYYQFPLQMGKIEMETVQNGTFNRSVNYLHVVQRSVECYMNIAAQEYLFSVGEYVDLAQSFMDITGMEIKAYLFCMTAITSSFFPSGCVDEFIWTNQMVYDLDNYSRHLGMSLTEAQTFFQMFTISVKEFNEVGLDSLSNRWDFNYFRQKPCIQLGKVFYPLDSQFVLENLWDGLYWRIIDGLEPSKANKFRIFFGRVFELYCNDLLKKASPSLKRAKFIPEFKYRFERNNLMSPDAFIDYGDDLIVIDYKTKRLKMQTTLIEGNLASFEQDILQMVIDPVRKIHTHIQRLLETQIEGVPIDFTKVKRVHGIVVTQGSLSGIKVVYERIEQKLRDEGFYDVSLPIEWHILDVNEFEAMVSLMEQGVNLSNTFLQKASQRYRHISFHNYLAYARRPNQHIQFAKERFNKWLDYVVSNMKINLENDNQEI